jgi:hypothetical protein
LRFPLAVTQDIEGGRNIPSPALWIEEKLVVAGEAKALQPN